MDEFTVDKGLCPRLSWQLSSGCGGRSMNLLITLNLQSAGRGGDQHWYSTLVLFFIQSRILSYEMMPSQTDLRVV